LPSSRASLLAAVLGAKTVLPVKEAEDKEPFLPGTIYLAPPDYHLLVERGHTLALSVDGPLHFSRPAIDVLFESAAEAYGARLAGVILTGANEDGAQGLAAIGRAGGQIAVQSPAESLVRNMPDAAIAAAHPERVWPVVRIAAWLAELAGARRGRSDDRNEEPL
jgi:two-component system chemotaxis response regulator CheB